MIYEKILKRRSSRWLLVFGFWTSLGLFFSTQTYFIHKYIVGRPPSLELSLVCALLDWYVWAPLAPLILMLARRYPIERKRWFTNGGLHIIASLFASAIHLYIALRILQLIGPSFGYDLDFTKSVYRNFSLQFHWNVLTYWLIVGVSLYRKQDLLDQMQRKQALLEASVTQAKLQALQMQLHPHFFFNTLSTISALMYTNVELANSMLIGLSDMLRLTLDNASTQEVPLKQELKFLECYLKIEQIRFEDSLTMDMKIDPETLDAQVPNLLLQPLVENSILHGIAQRPVGWIEISAKRENDMLLIHVRDDGPGLPDGQLLPAKEGIGLKNTRDRLQYLYGSAHRFELGNADNGGFVVSLSIPFRYYNGDKELQKHREHQEII